MRRRVDRDRVHDLLRRLGCETPEPTTCYLSGGATAILYGWRDTSRDVDLRFEPDRDQLFAAVARLKDELQTNIELASPADFIPMPDGWRDRSPLVAREGHLTIRHMDLVAQALAKIERGHPQDELDVAAMLAGGHITRADIVRGYAQVEARLVRFPAIDAHAFRAKVEAVTERPTAGP